MDIVKKIMWGLLMFAGVIVMIVSSAVFGASASFRDRTLAWFLENGAAILALIMITFAIIFLGIDAYKAKDANYRAAADQVNIFIKEEYRPTVWTKFKNYVNPKRKINQYEEVLRVEMHNLEQTASEEDLMLYDSIDEKDKEKKEINTYCQKRKFLENRTSKIWLEANIKYIKVDYDEIDINVIVSGYFPKKKKGVRQVNDFVTKAKTIKLIWSRTPMIILITGIFMFLSSMILTFDFGATFWANTGIKIMSMAWNIFIAIRFTDEWNKTVILKDIMFQAGMVAEYRSYVRRILKEKFLDEKGGEENDD